MDEGLKNKAYLEGSRLKKAGHDDEVIAARLEKMGIPEGLIEQVIFNLSVQRIIDNDKAARPFYYSALVKIGIGVLLAIISSIAIPGQTILPIGLIVTGIIAAVANKKQML